ncbi:hypothetical protein MKW92_001633, partial [Papaver armeniacum]
GTCMVVRKLIQCEGRNKKVLFVPKVDDESQRKKLFMLKGIILEKVCDFIIDSGSTENLV